MREASAPDASLSLGSSFVPITIRVGNVPVHASRFLVSIAIVSSPLIDSRRSTTTECEP